MVAKTFGSAVAGVDASLITIVCRQRKWTV